MKLAGTVGVVGESYTGALVVTGLTFLKFAALTLQNKIIHLEEIMTKKSFKRTILTFLVSMLEVTWAIGASVYAGILLA